MNKNTIPKNKKQLNINIDRYLYFRLDMFANYWGMSKTNALSTILDIFFNDCEKNMEKKEMDSLIYNEKLFVDHNPDYSLSDFKGLRFLGSEEKGRFYSLLKKKGETE